jgi:hypothetical protein
LGIEKKTTGNRPISRGLNESSSISSIKRLDRLAAKVYTNPTAEVSIH